MKHPITMSIVVAIIVMVVGTVAYALLTAKRVSAPTTPPRTTGINSKIDSVIDIKLDHMSLQDKIASLLILHKSGTDVTTLQNFISSYSPGGFILMGDNIPVSDAAMQTQTAALRGKDSVFPRLVAIDEEGDTVKRLKGDDSAGAETLRNLPVSATTAAFSERSEELQDLGITLNFGIIADTTADPSSFIYQRVLGTTTQSANERVAAAVRASSGKTLSTIKHFPGHGETEVDSHTDLQPILTSYSDWQKRDEPPFEAGIKAGTDIVMMGHLRYTAIDDLPASLSKKWHDILRNDLGFKGIIVTDDMLMLEDSGDPVLENMTKNAITALQAGNTMLLYVNDNGAAHTMIDPTTIINAITTAVNDGQLSESLVTNDARLVLEAQAKTASFLR